MNYIDKVRYMIDRQKREPLTDEYYIDIHYRDSHWLNRELEEIVKPYPYVPDSYIKFIKAFDSLGLSFVTFYGSQKRNLIPLKTELQEFKPYLGDKYFPFAKHADGSVYVFDQSQKVKLFDIKDYEFEQEPEHIADNFIEFINDYLLGPKYFGNLEKDDSFSRFLRKVGWVKD
jgi:hypothetical protein